MDRRISYASLRIAVLFLSLGWLALEFAGRPFFRTQAAYQTVCNIYVFSLLAVIVVVLLFRFVPSLRKRLK